LKKGENDPIGRRKKERSISNNAVRGAQKGKGKEEGVEKESRPICYRGARGPYAQAAFGQKPGSSKLTSTGYMGEVEGKGKLNPERMP